MKNYTIATVIVTLFCLAGCQKDVQLEHKTPALVEYDAEALVTVANFSWKVDYPGKMSSVVKLSRNADMSGAERIGDDTPTLNKDYSVTATGLAKSTTYYYQFEAWNPGVSYTSEVFSFTTLDEVLASITTSAVTNIAQTTATGGGNVTSTGNATVTERGICWGTGHNPTTNGSHASSGTGTGSYTVNMTGLTPNITYYVRAYAVNSQGTAYGTEVSFTTLQTVTLPTVTTSQVTNIAQTTATGGGNVTSMGNATVTERGICWGTGHNPTTNGSHASSGTGTGSYTVNMTGLTPNTTYYVRAYAVNSQGTAYGTEVSFTTLQNVPQGAINGLFSVSAGQQVYFSQGNLQYKASTNTWQFADNQYDYIGDNNHNISQTYSGWIDLFGWGTSGWSSGAWCYQPWSTSTSYSDYYPGGSYTNNLMGSYANADWGVYNAISNGGNQAGLWRTLTKDEWVYVFNTRSTSSGIRYAKARVNNVNGVILLPDDWSTGYYSLSSANSAEASFSSNTITASQWSALEQHGAVFLPAAGRRNGTSVGGVGSYGYYWSASYYNSGYAYYVWFYDSSLYPRNSYYRYYGHSVRLVRSAQ